jgi:arylsulfatase
MKNPISLTRREFMGRSALASAGMMMVPRHVLGRGYMAAKKPNILVIMSDDVGPFNISAYNHGMMGYKTPNIDRLAREGAMFTDWYGQQSCTAGRAAFITGQTPIRTGLLKIGLPGAKLGINQDDPTLATLLKPYGYMTGKFGKNHLGDRNEHLPTVNGFDEWFGNLYHLNAEEEPEQPGYPKDPAFKAKYGPRGLLHTYATDKDDPTVDPRFGRVGKQRIEEKGSLTIKHMETIDDEITAASISFMEKATKAGKPFFVWHNSTRMHMNTHLRKEFDGKTGLGIFADGMMEHDGHVGQILDKLKELGIEDNTIVVYTSDNGPMCSLWPDGGTTIFRGEKNTQWEGGYRVPMYIRWPGVIKPGTVINEIGAHEDIVPTLMAAVGDTTVKSDLLKGRKIGDKTYKVHLDGENLLPFFKGEVAKSPRQQFIYWTDGGEVAALRWGDWKLTFLRQNSKGFKVWETPFEELRMPMMTNLRSDPTERAVDESVGHLEWYFNRSYLFPPAIEYIGQWISSFREFPPRAKPGTFGLSDMVEAMTTLAGGNK